MRVLFGALLIPAFLVFGMSSVHAFPNVCTVVKSADFDSCMDLKVGGCICPFPVPRPCSLLTYYVPQTFVEVLPDPRDSYFYMLPGASVQLATLLKMPIPYGVEDDQDTQSYQAHVIAIPFASVPYSQLPCGGNRLETSCFDAMSEHLGSLWNTGSGDAWEPSFLAWSLSPKGCLLKGALTSWTGEPTLSFSPGKPSCSIPMSWLRRFPPSAHSVCNGWGIFFPRSGSYNGPSQTMGALMIASRIKSLGAEVFLNTPASPDERWQMIYPQSSSCFREGYNIGLLETLKGVREEKRLMNGRMKGYLFVVWRKVSCCKDLWEVPKAYLALGAMKATCQTLGGGAL